MLRCRVQKIINVNMNEWMDAKLILCTQRKKLKRTGKLKIEFEEGWWGRFGFLAHLLKII